MLLQLLEAWLQTAAAGAHAVAGQCAVHASTCLQAVLAYYSAVSLTLTGWLFCLPVGPCLLRAVRAVQVAAEVDGGLQVMYEKGYTGFGGPLGGCFAVMFSFGASASALPTMHLSPQPQPQPFPCCPPLCRLQLL